MGNQKVSSVLNQSFCQCCWLFPFSKFPFHKPSLFSYFKMHFHVRFLKMKSCALTIQRAWRATRAARTLRQQFLATRSAALKIQLAYRQYRARRILREVCLHWHSDVCHGYFKSFQYIWAIFVIRVQKYRKGGTSAKIVQVKGIQSSKY